MPGTSDVRGELGDSSEAAYRRGRQVGLAIGAWLCHTRYAPCLAKALWDAPIDPPVTQEWWYCGA